RVLTCDPPLPRRFPPLLHELHGPVDGRFQDGGIERSGDGVADRAFKGFLGHVQVVSAHGGPALAVVGAAVEEAAPAAVVAAHGDQGAAAQRAAAEPAQKIARGEIETGPRLSGPRPEGIARARQAAVRAFPEFGRDNSQLLGREPQPFGGGALSLGLGASADDLLASVPDDGAAVEVAVENFTDSCRRPAPTMRTRRGDALGVQSLSDSGEAAPVGTELEDPADDVGLRVVDLTRSEEHTSELQSLAYLVCRL